MLDLDDFDAAVRLNERRFWFLTGAFAGSVAVFALLVAWLGPMVSAWHWVQALGEVERRLLSALLILPFVIFFPIRVLGIERQTSRDPRLICPCCGESIRGIRDLLVTTHNCGHCGKKILGAPGWPGAADQFPPVRPEVGWLSIEEIRVASKPAAQRPVWPAAGAIGYFIGFMALSGMMGLLDRDPAPWPGFNTMLRNILWIVGFVPAFAIMFGGFWWFELVAKRDPRLICPACGQSIHANSALVIATRSCDHCGNRIVRDAI